MRQLIAEGLKPPCILFVQSKERAVEVFQELVYVFGRSVVRPFVGWFAVDFFFLDWLLDCFG